MPYDSIKDAQDAKFPTKAEGISLTLAQINKKAEKVAKLLDVPVENLKLYSGEYMD